MLAVAKVNIVASVIVYLSQSHQMKTFI